MVIHRRGDPCGRPVTRIIRKEKVGRIRDKVRIRPTFVFDDAAPTLGGHKALPYGKTNSFLHVYYFGNRHVL